MGKSISEAPRGLNVKIDETGERKSSSLRPSSRDKKKINKLGIMVISEDIGNH